LERGQSVPPPTENRYKYYSYIVKSTFARILFTEIRASAAIAKEHDEKIF